MAFSFGGKAATQQAAPSFSFGGASSAAPAFGAAAQGAAVAAQMPAFSFGGAAASSGPAATAPSFGFGAGSATSFAGATAAPAFSFGGGGGGGATASSGAAAAAPGFSFGGGGGATASSGAAAAPAFSFGGGATASSSGPAFGSGSAAFPPTGLNALAAAAGSSTPAFGSTAPAFGFGSAASGGVAAPASFGSSAPAFSFGGAAASSAAGPAFLVAPTSATPFGATGATSGSGNPAFTSTVFQTGAPKSVGTEVSMNIVSMPAYQGKSADELRLEDYMANKHKQGTAPAPAFGSAAAATPSFTAAAASSCTFGVAGASKSTGAGSFGTGGSCAAFGGFGVSTTSATAFGAPAATTNAFAGFKSAGAGVSGAPRAFGGFTETATAVAPTPAAPSGFSFHAAAPGTSGASAPGFGFSSVASVTTSAVTPTFGFGGGVTGTAAPAPTSAFSFGTGASGTSISTTTGPIAAGFSFGGATATTTGASTVPPAAQGFSFGGVTSAAPAGSASAASAPAAPAAATGAVGFGVAATGSTGGGFSFAGVTTAAASSSQAASSGAAGAGFSFGGTGKAVSVASTEASAPVSGFTLGFGAAATSTNTISVAGFSAAATTTATGQPPATSHPNSEGLSSTSAPFATGSSATTPSVIPTTPSAVSVAGATPGMTASISALAPPSSPHPLGSWQSPAFGSGTGTVGNSVVFPSRPRRSTEFVNTYSKHSGALTPQRLRTGGAPRSNTNTLTSGRGALRSVDSNCRAPAGSAARGTPGTGNAKRSDELSITKNSGHDTISASSSRNGEHSDNGEQMQLGSVGAGNDNPLMIGLGALLPALRDTENTPAHPRAAASDSTTSRGTAGDCRATPGASSERSGFMVDEDEDEDDSFTSVNSSLNSSHGTHSADTSISAAPRTSPFATAARLANESERGRDGLQASDEPKLVPYNPSLLNPKWAASPIKDRLNDDEEDAGADRQDQQHEHTGPSLYPLLPCGPGCYSIPDMATLQAMTEAEKSCVSDLVIGRTGFGEIQWRDQPNGGDLGQGTGVDLSGKFVLMDDMVRWEGKAGRCTGVELWPDRDDNQKPAIGVGLNKPAVVTLQFRKHFERSQMARDVQAGGMSFVDYEPQTGRLQFAVDHF